MGIHGKIYKRLSIFFVVLILCYSPFITGVSQTTNHDAIINSSFDVEHDYVQSYKSLCYDEIEELQLKQRNSMYSHNNLTMDNNVRYNRSSVSMIPQQKTSLNDIYNQDGQPLGFSGHWPMYCYNNHHIGRSPYSTSSNNGAVLWRFEMDRPIESGVSIGADGTIYFGGYDGYLYAMNPDGSVKWKCQTGGMILSSTPTITDDGTIYVGNWGYHAGLAAINAKDGTLRWEMDIGDSVDTSPAVADDGTIYIGTMGGIEHIGYIIAVNPNGTVKWKYATDDYITSSPAIDDDGIIYIGSADTYLYALYPNGTLKWRFKTDDKIKGPASITDEGIIYIGSFDGYLYALHSNDGSLIWKCKLGSGTQTNPSIGPDGTIYVGGVDIFAVNPDGSLKWTYEIGGHYIHMSSPAVSAGGTVYIGTCTWSSGGDIIAVKDGTLLWRWNICDDEVQSSPCIGSDGRVYIGAHCDADNDNPPEGYLYAFGQGTMSPPYPPSIDGPTTGKISENYKYTINTTDPQGFDIYYYLDFGDGYCPGWGSRHESGEPITPDHIYYDTGTYIIRAKAKNEFGLESDWSTLEVTMPKNKVVDSFLVRFFDNHPRLFPLLRQMLEIQ